MKLLLVLFLIVFFSFNSFANEIIVKVSLSPAGSFEAKSLKLKGEVKKIDKKFIADQLWVKTEELKTGIDLRDEHFHKYLNYEKNAKIFFSEVVAENGVGSGNLTVNEVKKNIKFIYLKLVEKLMSFFSGFFIKLSCTNFIKISIHLIYRTIKLEFNSKKLLAPLF